MVYNMAFKQAVKDPSKLPLVGNADKDLRIVLNTGHTYQWSATSSTWINRGTISSSFNCYPVSTDDLTDVDAEHKYVSQEHLDKMALITITQPANIDEISDNLQDHIDDLLNPHAVTKAQVGLGNADNTSDINKPISTAQGVAIVSALSDANSYTDGRITSLINSAPVSLDTLKELSDALGNDPNFATTVSTAMGYRLRVDTPSQGLNSTQKTNGKTNLDLQNVDNTSDVNKPVSTAQATAIGVVQTDLNGHKSNTSNPHSVTKAQVGLGNADNTSDLDKPISTATQSALDLKAPLASPALTGTPTVPTAILGTSTTQAASTAFVQAAIGVGWQFGTVTTNGSGLATFTFPTPFDSGVVPVVTAVAVAPNTSNLYSVQLNAAPTNTSCQIKVNVIGGASINLLGLLSLTIFSAAPSGVVVHVMARAP